jgi:hypothetical protein
VTLPRGDQEIQDDRLFLLVRRLLGIRTIELRATFTEAATIIAEAVAADEVDVFVYEPPRSSLVALGTSRTRMRERQLALGPDVLPLANGGRTARVFRTGTPYLTGRADEDPEELRGIVEGPGVRSVVDLPLEVDGERRGPCRLTRPGRASLANVTCASSRPGGAGSS